MYIATAIVLNMTVSAHLTELNDDLLAARLSTALHEPAMLGRPVSRTGTSLRPDNGDIDGDVVPVFLWLANGRGAITAYSPGAPALSATFPAGSRPPCVLGQRGSGSILDLYFRTGRRRSPDRCPGQPLFLLFRWETHDWSAGPTSTGGRAGRRPPGLILITGTLPSVVAGSGSRVEVLPGPRFFDLVISAVQGFSYRDPGLTPLPIRIMRRVEWQDVRWR